VETKIVMTLIVLLVFMIFVGSLSSAIAFKLTSTTYQDGFNKGKRDARCDWNQCHSHGKDDSCPRGHTVRKILGMTTKDNIEATKNFVYFVNDYFINAVINGEEDLNYLNTLQRKNKDSDDFIIHQDWKNKSDFIGLDYYRRVYIYSSNIVSLSSGRFVGGAPINDLNVETNQPHGILNDLGWEIYPKGLYNLIMKIKTQWNKSVPITENGIADKSDSYRAPFIVAHLDSVKQAIESGADVIGYLHWSFMDNYEWLDNYRPEGKFGLFSIERSIGDRNKQSDLTRQKTKGAEALELIMKESLSQSKAGIVSDSAIAAAENKFGKFAADGSHIIHT
jgi:beta-glucosidase/6-phospho-beta-glucosidase/beta-galactosidase